MKKLSGPVLLMLLFLATAMAGAAVLAIAGVNMIQRAAGVHATPEPSQPSVARGPAEGSQQPTGPAPMSSTERQQWADEKIDQWLETYNASNLGAFSAPYRYVEAWLAPAEGELEVLTSASRIKTESNLTAIAEEIMEVVGVKDPRLVSVTASTSDGSMSRTVGR